MTPKQQRFIQEYLIDGNASAAYQRAGYAAQGNVAEANACRLLRNAQVQAALRVARTALSEKTQLTAAWVETRLMEVAERCLQHKEVLDQDGAPTGEYRFDPAGANRALELLGKRLKLFVDKVALTDPTGEKPLASPLAAFSLEERKEFLAYLRQRKADEEDKES